MCGHEDGWAIGRLGYFTTMLSPSLLNSLGLKPACDGPEITEPSLIENTEPWRVHFTVSPDTWVMGEPW